MEISPNETWDCKEFERKSIGLRFDSSMGVKWENWIFSIVLLATYFPAVVFLPAVGCFDAIKSGSKLIYFLAPYLLIGLIGGYFVLKAVACRLRLYVAFHRDRVQIGGGIVKRVFPYEEVELVALPQSGEKGDWIAVHCRGAFARIFPVTAWVSQVMVLLRGYCSNAAFIDRQGVVSLPTHPTSPDRSLTGLQRFYSRRSRRLGFGAVIVACSGVYFDLFVSCVVDVFLHRQPSMRELYFAVAVVTVLHGGAILLLVRTARRSRKMAAIVQSVRVEHTLSNQIGNFLIKKEKGSC